MNANPLAAYRETRVKTASPGQLVVMLYDEAIKQSDTAIRLLGSDSKPRPEDIERINMALGKVQDVITEIKAPGFDNTTKVILDLVAAFSAIHAELTTLRALNVPSTAPQPAA